MMKDIFKNTVAVGHMRKGLKTVMKALPVVVCMLVMASCGEQFHVTGSISNAKDSLLYFEHNGLDGFTTVDSVKLDDAGSFDFAGDAVDNPEFYRLRIAGQIINIGIDSTETVDVKASYPMMASDYDVKGSYENEKIKELALKQMQLQSRCQAAGNDSIVNVLIDGYKQDVERNYIFKEPMRAYSYFALFQYVVIGNQARMIFDPTRDANDNKVFGAVATSWDTYYPDCDRTKNLHNITIQGMKNDRIVKSEKRDIEIDASKVSTSGVIEIALNDNHGNLRRLTDLKGQVVMLDFHVFSAGEESTKRIMALRSLYNKYHERGFEIYQISLDPNQHFWLEQTANLPWISVWAPQNQQEQLLANYNVQSIPTYFLIDRNNVLQKRDVQIKDLDKEIESML